MADKADMTKEQVMYVADLARLEVSEEETKDFAKELYDIIHYAEVLNELDTTGVEPTTHVQDLKNVLRDDTPQQWEHQKEALDLAPDKSMGQFRVPSILE